MATMAYHSISHSLSSLSPAYSCSKLAFDSEAGIKARILFTRFGEAMPYQRANSSSRTFLIHDGNRYRI